jgi:very-short-patch-repair endonuclease
MKDYNWSERLDHIAYMFNVRTNRKKYENFIVNAIYTKVNNQELMPVTQQCVKNEGKYYFIDLYFPQINFGVEIDEGHHLNEENKKKDQVREEDIKTAIECEVMRISIFDERKKKKTYQEICKDIDKTVDRINFLISEKGSIKWISNDEEKNKVIENKQFSITDNAYYNSITEIYNICGGKLDGSGDAESLGGCYYRRNEEYHLWVPTLTIEHNGNTAAAKTKYMNFLSENKETITEISQNGFKEDDYLEKNKRAVFLRVKDVFGRKCIKFIGIFKFNNYEEGNNNKRFFIRIAETVKISDLRPTSNT